MGHLAMIVDALFVWRCEDQGNIQSKVAQEDGHVFGTNAGSIDRSSSNYLGGSTLIRLVT